MWQPGAEQRRRWRSWTPPPRLRTNDYLNNSGCPDGRIVSRWRPNMTLKAKVPFDPEILATLGDEITFSDYRPGQVIYAQGDSGEAVFYIQKGRVKLTVVSKFGKQAVTGVLRAGSFLGEFGNDRELDAAFLNVKD